MKCLLFGTVPDQLECPDAILGDIEAVLSGEYEAGFDGEGLTIEDLGANVGAISLAATARWPDSTVHSYEPNPDTFRSLSEEVGQQPLTLSPIAQDQLPLRRLLTVLPSAVHRAISTRLRRVR